MLRRCPEGIAARSCFFQKHVGRGLGPRHVVDASEAFAKKVIYVTEAEQIVGLAQLDAVELHGWGCRLPRCDRPDWIVFDLDPDESLPFRRVVDAALSLREELARLGLETFVKTTGGKGLHVVVPLAPRHDWGVVSAFSEMVAKGMAKRAPRDYVATMSKAARRGKIFVDHFRNAPGATAILPYSARARPGLPIAMPVAWGDLSRIDPQDFTVETAAKILARRRKDPWGDLLATRGTLSRRILAALRAE
jgi:bifunctional non-homologous end joining protein LigD